MVGPFERRGVYPRIPESGDPSVSNGPALRRNRSHRISTKRNLKHESSATSSAAASTAFPNGKAAYDYFIGKGLTNLQAAAVVGNLDQESGVNPTISQENGGAGRGIAQWSAGGRWDKDPGDNLVAFGWLVKGTLDDVPFVGYVGNRWGRCFIIVDGALREEAGVAVGDTVTMVVEPTMSAKAFAKACEQSKVTTAPAKGRADAIDMPKSPTR